MDRHEINKSSKLPLKPHRNLCDSEARRCKAGLSISGVAGCLPKKLLRIFSLDSGAIPVYAGVIVLVQ